MNPDEEIESSTNIAKLLVKIKYNHEEQYKDCHSVSRTYFNTIKISDTAQKTKSIFL